MKSIKKLSAIILLFVLTISSSSCVTGLLKTRSAANKRKATEKKLDVGKSTDYVNVMGKEMPAMPEFPSLSKKAGMVRGYVKDTNGNPLQGAQIGVRSTAIGGAYSGAQGETDEDGFYEFEVPMGAAHFYNAGYTIDYGEGRAAMSLHPADGKLDSFASTNGAVENFVLLPFGITNKDTFSENPQNSGTYYGGYIYISYFTAEENDTLASPQNIRENSEIVITLTPEEKLIDGSDADSFVIRKIATSVGFKILNIPVGCYKITAKLSNGDPLKMSLTKPKGTPFGMSPAETTRSATVIFQPDGAKANMAIPAYGNWNSVEIALELP